MTAHYAFLIAAAVCFALASLNVASPVNLTALGLLFALVALAAF